MLCCHHFEILNNLLNGGLHFHFALGPTNHAVSSHLQIRQMKQLQELVRGTEQFMGCLLLISYPLIGEILLQGGLTSGSGRGVSHLAQAWRWVVAQKGYPVSLRRCIN